MCKKEINVTFFFASYSLMMICDKKNEKMKARKNCWIKKDFSFNFPVCQSINVIQMKWKNRYKRKIELKKEKGCLLNQNEACVWVHKMWRKIENFLFFVINKTNNEMNFNYTFHII